MTFWDCFIKLQYFVILIGVLFGVVYPAVMVVLYKLAGSKLSIKEILRRI